MARKDSLPTESLILVVGATGFIASYLCDVLLELGYRVRGTVRDVKKSQWLSEHLEDKHGSGRFEMAAVADANAPHALDEALKGCSACAYTVIPFLCPNPNECIPKAVAGVRNVLESCAAETGIKRFVFTSTSMAASPIVFNEEIKVTQSSWNEGALKEAYAPPPYEPHRMGQIYAAAKLLSEREISQFVEERRPGFTYNIVLPNSTIGKLKNVHAQKSSSVNWLLGAATGQWDLAHRYRSQHYVDVGDCARVHAAALIDRDVVSQRLFSYAAPFHQNQAFAYMRRVVPSEHVMPDWDEENWDRSKVESGPAEKLLQKHFNKTWTSFDDAMTATANNLIMSG